MTWELAGAILIAAGSLFTMLGAIGLTTFRTTLARMHAGSKPQMLGLILLSSGMVMTLRTWQWALAAALVVAVQMVAAPVAAHLLGRAAFHREDSASSQASAADQAR